jgi:hypothetical protein
MSEHSDELETARDLARHYQGVAAEQGNKIIRLRTALLILREFGGFGRFYHPVVTNIMRDWLEGSMDGPVPWPESQFFEAWAKTQGMSNVDGFVGYRFSAKLER